MDSERRLNKRLIVNADDFGLSEGVNQGIIECHKRGIVTSTTVLANGDAFHHAISLAKACPSLSVGLHLNANLGAPLLSANQVSSLVDPGTGRFYPWSAFLLKLIGGRIGLVELEEEFRAQVRRVIEADIRISHLDSHKHIHGFSPVLELLVKLAEKFGISRVRVLDNSFRSCHGLVGLGDFPWRGLARNLVVQALVCGMRLKLREKGIVSPDFFLGMVQCGRLNTKVLLRMLSCLRPGVSELMCHPGYVDLGLKEVPVTLKESREEELRALTDLRVMEQVSEKGIELISYERL